MARRPGWVLAISLLLLTAFVAIGVAIPERLAEVSQSLFSLTTRHFGWLYLFATSGFLVVCLGIALSDYGRIRLGADGEMPEFSYPTWLGMIFSAGMGVGLVFWGVAEPMTHFANPPLGLAEARSPEAAGLALRYSLFHWGFHQWANFALVGLAIAYVRFRLGRPGLISETFRATLGHRVDGALGHGINILAVLSTVFGVATTLGLGIIQLNSGLDAVAGIGFGTTQQLSIMAGITVVFLACAMAPLESGVRYVSDANMVLAGLVLALVFFLGPSDFIIAALTNAIGDYFSNVMGMSLAMSPYTQEDWVERWTIFYWAWGLSWAPFVGSFVARISRGRTVREFVLGVIGMPSLLSAIWFATFGGGALHAELFGNGGVSAAVEGEMSAGLFALIADLPLADVLAWSMVVLIVLFVITSANSATFVLGMFSGRGALSPHRLLRLTWGIVQVLVASVLLLSGGLAALQALSIVAAFPFMLLMLFMTAALLKSLRTERRQQELHEALLMERVQRLIEQQEHQQAENLEPPLQPQDSQRND